MQQDSPRESDLPPGYDEESPYEGEDLSDYPQWWCNNIRQFREHGMRPYRPPRLVDGIVSPPFVAQLESEHDVEIWFRSDDPGSGEWNVIVDGDRTVAVNHERTGDGYTVYGITSEELREAVEDAVGNGPTAGD